MYALNKPRREKKLSAGRPARICAVLLAGLLLAGCQTQLHTGLSQDEAQQMILALQSQGISASRSSVGEGKYAISIERGDMVQAMRILSSHGLPRKKHENIGSIFKGDQIVSTPFEQHARFVYALSEEISASLAKVHGVVSARVHITLPKPEPFRRTSTRSRASVYIYHAQDVDLRGKIPMIKSLVVNSVEKLNYEDVTVAMFEVAGGPAPTLAASTIKVWNSVTTLAGIALLLFVGIALWTGVGRPKKLTGEGGARLMKSNETVSQ